MEWLPHLGGVRMRTAANRNADKIPSFLHAPIAALACTDGSPVCFVLPRRHDMARWTAVLYSLNRFISRFPRLAAEYADKAFPAGERVRVNPSGHVYEFGGVFLERPDYFWLRLITSRGRANRSQITIPIAHVLRLELTNRTRPTGTTTLPENPPPSPVDRLLGVNTWGNLSLMRNEAVLLDTKRGFEEFAETAILQRGEQDAGMPPLKALLPFGELQPPLSEGQPWLTRWDSVSMAGEPLVAIAHSSERLAEYCREASEKSVVVIANGLAIGKNLQDFDAIAAKQRMILFADHDDEEMIAALSARNCRFWWADENELAPTDSNSGLFRVFFRQASNFYRFVIRAELCASPVLEELYLTLESLRTKLPQDDNTPLTTSIRRAWALFADATGALEPPPPEVCAGMVGRIRSIKEEALRQRMWMSPEACSDVLRFSEAAARCYGNPPALGGGKGATLQRIVMEFQRAGVRFGLIARNEKKAADLRAWLQRQQFDAAPPVYSSTSIPPDSEFDHLLCTAWFGGDGMRTLVSRLAAPRITVLAYPWENRWLNQSKPRLLAKPDVPLIQSPQKKAVLDGTAMPATPVADDARAGQNHAALAEPDIWTFERRLRAARIGTAAHPTDADETVPARYVRFAGDAYAFLTDSHKIPVATELLASGGHAEHELPERTVLEVRPSDYIVFPESGEHEILQDAADRLLGKDAVQLRKTARLWQTVLQESRIPPEKFAATARALGHPRHIVTVRNWFTDTSQIGPRHKDDILLIAVVTESKALETAADEVQTAIEKLRGAHQCAGKRLRDILLDRLPDVMGKVEEAGTKVSLNELGAAWIVQVESVSEATEPRGKTEVNRLLWVDQEYGGVHGSDDTSAF
jgi:hypothetical protein